MLQEVIYMKLTRNNLKEYWVKRSDSQGRDTVGHASNIGKQAPEYQQKYDFVVNSISTYSDINKSTVDYGSGVGRWSDIFPNYIGLELTKNLFHFACEDHTDKRIINITEPFEITDHCLTFERLFTSTVLQHNHIEDIMKFFESIKRFNFNEFVFYENAEATDSHCEGRIGSVYVDVLSKYFNIKSHTIHTHICVGQKHDITIIKC